MMEEACGKIIAVPSGMTEARCSVMAHDKICRPVLFYKIAAISNRCRTAASGWNYAKFVVQHIFGNLTSLSEHLSSATKLCGKAETCLHHVQSIQRSRQTIYNLLFLSCILSHIWIGLFYYLFTSCFNHDIYILLHSGCRKWFRFPSLQPCRHCSVSSLIYDDNKSTWVIESKFEIRNHVYLSGARVKSINPYLFCSRESKMPGCCPYKIPNPNLYISTVRSVLDDTGHWRYIAV